MTTSRRQPDTREHAVRVAAPPREVFDHLRDPRNYVGLSPLVVEARDIRDEDGLLHYVAVERFRFLGVLRYDNPIAVTLRADEGDPARLVVRGDVDSPGNVQLAYSYEITPDGSGSRVLDRIAVTAPWGLRRFAVGRAGEVQLARGRILAERLGGAS